MVMKQVAVTAGLSYCFCCLFPKYRVQLPLAGLSTALHILLSIVCKPLTMFAFSLLTVDMCAVATRSVYCVCKVVLVLNITQ